MKEVKSVKIDNSLSFSPSDSTFYKLNFIKRFIFRYKLEKEFKKKLPKYDIKSGKKIKWVFIYFYDDTKEYDQMTGKLKYYDKWLDNIIAYGHINPVHAFGEYYSFRHFVYNFKSKLLTFEKTKSGSFLIEEKYEKSSFYWSE